MPPRNLPRSWDAGLRGLNRYSWMNNHGAATGPAADKADKADKHDNADTADKADTADAATPQGRPLQNEASESPEMDLLALQVGGNISFQPGLPQPSLAGSQAPPVFRAAGTASDPIDPDAMEIDQPGPSQNLNQGAEGSGPFRTGGAGHHFDLSGLAGGGITNPNIFNARRSTQRPGRRYVSAAARRAGGAGDRLIALGKNLPGGNQGRVGPARTPNFGGLRGAFDDEGDVILPNVSVERMPSPPPVRGPRPPGGGDQTLFGPPRDLKNPETWDMFPGAPYSNMAGSTIPSSALNRQQLGDDSEKQCVAAGSEGLERCTNLAEATCADFWHVPNPDSSICGRCDGEDSDAMREQLATHDIMQMRAYPCTTCLHDFNANTPLDQTGTKIFGRNPPDSGDRVRVKLSGRNEVGGYQGTALCATPIEITTKY